MYLTNELRLIMFFIKKSYYYVLHYLFSFGNAWSSSIDATYSDGLGKLVNDSPPRYANSIIKKIFAGGQTRLCIFAKKNIMKGEELRYDYGVKDLPWRSKKGNKTTQYFVCAQA